MERGIPPRSRVRLTSILNALLTLSPSRITGLALPVLPPPSPLPTTTIFPDEPVAQSEPLTVAPSALHLAPSSPIPIPIDIEIAPRPVWPTIKRARTSAYSPTLTAPDWTSIDNYHPAQSASDAPPKFLMPLESDYAADLPEIPPLPTAKRKTRKGKEKEQGDMFRLYASSKHNPLSDNLRTSAKVVLTGDWNVAMAELRHVRAMERIEQKEAEGRWSLRQPRKPRSLPVPKSHWDYLLEEMVGQGCEWC